MELNQLKSILDRLHPLASLRLTFKHGNDGIVGLARLKAYDDHSVRIDPIGLMSAMLDINAGKWDVSANRTIRVSFPMTEMRDELAQTLYRDIERVVPGSDTPLSRLLSGRQKMREQAAAEMLDTIIPDDLKKRAAEWGWEILGEVVEETGLLQLRIVLSEKGAILAELRLDAATGQIMQDGHEHRFCSEIASARERAEQLYTDYLKKLETETAV